MQSDTSTYTVSYTHLVGVSKQLTLQVTVISPFSLTADVFNPSIWDSFEPYTFEPETFSVDSFEPDTLDITVLHRGVIGVSKVGYIDLSLIHI